MNLSITPRQVHIGFFKNEELALLSAHSRLLFIGLWILSDDNGLVKYSHNRIKAEIFPYEDINIEQAIDNLARTKEKFIIINDDTTIQVSKFKEYQEEKSKKFIKPTLEQVKTYALPLGFTERKCEEFLSFYESKGWKIGKTKMSSWKHAIQTWVKKSNLKPTTAPVFDFGDEAKYYYDADLILNRVKAGFYPEFLKKKFEALPAKHRALVLNRSTPEQRKELLGE